MGKDKGQIKSGCSGSKSNSSSLEEMKKGQCGKKEEIKKNSCADMKKAEESRRKDDEGCICRSSNSSLKKKEEKKCSSDKSSKGKKPKCDSSKKEFKKGLKGKEKGKECNSSYAEFLKERDNNKDSTSTEKSYNSNQCHSSYEKFILAKNEVEHCIESEEDVSSLYNEPCSKTLNDTVESAKSNILQTCASACDELKTTIESKTTCNDCNELAKKYVKHDLYSSGNTENEKLDCFIGEKEDLPAKKHPCPPIAEPGMTKVQKVTCPRDNTQQPLSSCFPLDARNKELNKCIDKYMNVDPSQVISKCSQYANVNVDKSEECAAVEKKIQQGCARPQLKRSNIPSALGQSRRRQLLSRWGPSAAIYLAATTAAFFWVTEWKEPLQFVKEALEGTRQSSSDAKESPLRQQWKKLRDCHRQALIRRRPTT